jgi:putative DNA methylase
VQPVVKADKYKFSVNLGRPTPEADAGTKTAGRGASFRCILSDTVIGGDYIKGEGKAGRMGARLMAIVAKGPRGKIYLPPNPTAEAAALNVSPTWRPSGEVPARLTGGTCVPYGLKKWGDLVTAGQLAALNCFSDLLVETHQNVLREAIALGVADDSVGLEQGGVGATAYSEAVCVYLAFVIDRLADHYTSLGRWQNVNQQLSNMFGRQAIPMMWDYPEANPFSGKGGSFDNLFDWSSQSIQNLGRWSQGYADQADAQTQDISVNKVISTDPPYYDNIAYADLSDFFYVWIQKNLRETFPTCLSTIAVPKTEELVAVAYRHGSDDAAESFFLSGMTSAMRNLAAKAHPEPPITIYYAFKQSETNLKAETSSTGWEAFLTAVHQAGLQLSGTWPLRTEMKQRMVGVETNALASSIVLVCRKRPTTSPMISRREFIRELNGVLPEALDEMTKGAGGEHSPVAPVDLSQAIIGPGMAIFSKYTAVLEADGSAMSVRTALQLINRFLAEDDFDAETLFCLHWFAQHGWSEGTFGTADTLSRGKGTSVDGMREAGVLQSGGGKVRLFKWAEYPTNWDPRTDAQIPIWEALHQLIRTLNQGGESDAGALLASLGSKAEAVRQLAYRLYTLCERLGQAEDARAYNELITSWTGIESAATASKPSDGLLPGFKKLEDLLNEPKTLERNHRAPPGRVKRHLPTIRVRRRPHSGVDR